MAIRSQGDDGIDAGRAARRNPTRENCGEGEEKADAEINREIDGVDFEKKTPQEAREHDDADEADR